MAFVSTSVNQPGRGFYFKLIVGVVLLCVPVGVSLLAQQQASSPALRADSQRSAIIAHLNAIIQFYRASTEPVQKAGEPNDVIYSDQAASLSAQAATFAFQSAKAQAGLLAAGAQGAAPDAGSEQQRMKTVAANAEQRVSDLQASEADLDKQIAAAKPKARAALQEQRKQVEGALELAQAMKDALGKIVGVSASNGDTGLAADIDRLQQSVPELQGKNKIANPQLVTLDAARSSGVTSQGRVLFELLGTRHTLESLAHQNDELRKQVQDLRAPLTAVLRSTIQQGQALSQQADQTPAAPVATSPSARSSKPGPSAITVVTTRFKSIAAATVPLSQEIIVLEQSQANLVAWQTSVDREYKSILHAILLRISVIVIALVFILGGGEIWSRATTKYVREIRRRRQLLLVRRIVVGFLSVIVVLFGFVTQFNSLATFAGFITAGIAVGLQTILLSVAAYFFIIGRYGVKVGDRITIASVTGDVIEVGLVRFYLMELAGAGTELNPTGRVAVFSNAVLFQAGTPLYKQVPGTEYAWHELIVKLNDAGDYNLVCGAVMKEVNAIVEDYRASIEAQHQSIENWMQTSIDPPVVESRLQFNAGVFQLWARFPVMIRNASVTDEKLTQALLHVIATSPEVKAAIASTPTIQASVRG